MMAGAKPRGLFVTGTDTGVGKTAVACALAAWGRAQGLRVGVMKPVATGGRWVRTAGRWVSHDALALAAAAGTNDPWSVISPICFQEPLAPATAARRAGAVIRLAPILCAFRAMHRRHDVVIVEGVGGLLVPLTPRATVATLARRIRLPLLVVSRPGLGTLNHTLLSLRLAAAERLRVAGVVFNEAARPDRSRFARISGSTNPGVVARAGGGPLAGVLPYRGRLLAGPWGRAWRTSLVRWVEQSVDHNWLRAWLLRR